MRQEPENLCLKPIEIPDLPTFVEIPATGMTLGRAQENSLSLPADGFPHVSSHHARIELTDGVLTVEDLGSKNGTLVNGKAVTRQALLAGDVLQLGKNVGPRFVVVAPGNLGATVTVAAQIVPEERIGTETAERLQDALGLPETERGIRDMVKRGQRRLLAAGGAAVIVVIALIALLVYQSAIRREDDARLISELSRELKHRLSETEVEIERQDRVLKERARSLEQERVSLKGELSRLEATGSASAAEIEGLRGQIASATEKLARMQPISLERLEASRRAIVQQAMRAVVFIEKKMYYKDSTSGARLFLTTDSRGVSSANFDGKGDPFFEEGGGSGFCVSADGWIITNAHVAEAEPLGQEHNLAALNLVREVELHVVFSETSERHPASVQGVNRKDENDLAVIRVEPFENVPHIENFSTDIGVPESGTELRLMGFPFGKNLPQEGDVVKASVFAALASRSVGKTLQVHAAVYPGNSGGPVIDGSGRVVGVVTSVQTLPSGQIAEIGYVIPISRLAGLWPPR